MSASSNGKILRIFVGVSEIAGYYGRIVESLRLRGVPINFGVITSHRFAYSNSIPLSDYKLQGELLDISRTSSSFKTRIRGATLRFHHFFWALRNHDVFVFTYGQSFFAKNADLPILRLLHKRIVVVLGHGADARPPWMDGAQWDYVAQTVDPIKALFRITCRQRAKIKRLERWCDEIIASRNTSQFLMREAIDMSLIGTPCDGTILAPQAVDGTRANLRVRHFPSNRKVKGSDYIADVIHSIKESGINVDYLEISNVSNSDVLAELNETDLLIDQMYSDSFLTGIGCEAGARGIAVLTSGLVFDLENGGHPIPPLFAVSPGSFQEFLSNLLGDSNAVFNCGIQLRNYLWDTWNTQAVADRFLLSVTGRAPKSWFFRPQNVSYIFGAGLPRSELLHIWHAGRDRYGLRFFQLRFRKDLEALIVNELLSLEINREA